MGVPIQRDPNRDDLPSLSELSQRECDEGTPAGPGTEDLLPETIGNNIREALDEMAEIQEQSLLDIEAEARLWKWLYVKFHGDWKYTNGDLDREQLLNRSAFGNFNFGAVMRALGFSETITRTIAHAASIIDNRELDPPEDLDNIFRGYWRQGVCNYQARY